MRTIDEAFMKVYAKRPAAGTSPEAAPQSASLNPVGHEANRPVSTFRADRPHALAAPPSSRRPAPGSAAPVGVGIGPTPLPAAATLTQKIDTAQAEMPAPHFEMVHVEVVGFSAGNVLEFPVVTPGQDALAASAIRASASTTQAASPPSTPAPMITPSSNSAPMQPKQPPAAAPPAPVVYPAAPSPRAVPKSESLFPEVGSAQTPIQDDSSAVERDASMRIERYDRPVTEQLKEIPTDGRFQPVWEVDAFGWPEVIDQLDRRARQALQETGRSLRRATQDGLSVLAVTSAARGHGRSTVAIQLAKTAAKNGMTVALIDGDTDRPTLAEHLCVEAERGWMDAVADGLPLEEVAIYSIADAVTLLPLVPWNQSVAKPRTDEAAIRQSVEQLTEQHDLVIIDCGPVGSLGSVVHSIVRQSMISAALLVCDQRSTADDLRDAGVARLQKLGIERIGIVENFVGISAK